MGTATRFMSGAGRHVSPLKVGLVRSTFRLLGWIRTMEATMEAIV